MSEPLFARPRNAARLTMPSLLSWGLAPQKFSSFRTYLTLMCPGCALSRQHRQVLGGHRRWPARPELRRRAYEGMRGLPETPLWGGPSFPCGKAQVTAVVRLDTCNLS